MEENWRRSSLQEKMLRECCLFLLTTFLLVITAQASRVHLKEENGLKSAVYLSPKIVLGAGSVANKFFYNIDFPRGHIALKYFNAELVDELGIPVPLHETYLHHWITLRYYAPKEENGDGTLEDIQVRNSGACPNVYTQYFGLGSETRRTDVHVPDPYGIEVGNPADIPDGYEERWYFNVHAIDTQGVVDRMGCTECRCDLYNISTNEFGPGYKGGLECCPDKAQCKLKKGFESIKSKLYLRYTVKWVDWVDTIVPVGIYILDVTDSGETPETSLCKIEYQVEACSTNECVDSKKATIDMPKGGQVVYGVAHQHAGAIGSALYGEDGRTICSSKAIYGEGKEAGNEAGYVVGMTTCYPKPGSVHIYNGEKVVLETNYSNTQMHAGVMGLFYLLIAD